MKIWYMRDNHTFRELPLKESDAIKILAEEFDKGNCNGMLCTKDARLEAEVVHARGGLRWSEFEVEARAWLRKAITLSQPPAEPVFRSYGWVCPTCGRGNAPFTTTCPCIPLPTPTFTC